MKITKIKSPKDKYYGGGYKIELPSGTLTLVTTRIGDLDELYFPSGLRLQINPCYDGFSMSIEPEYEPSEKYNICCSGSALGFYEFDRLTKQDKQVLAEYMIARWEAFKDIKTGPKKNSRKK